MRDDLLLSGIGIKSLRIAHIDLEDLASWR